jgi:hypothetical protein
VSGRARGTYTPEPPIAILILGMVLNSAWRLLCLAEQVSVAV